VICDCWDVALLVAMVVVVGGLLVLAWRMR